MGVSGCSVHTLIKTRYYSNIATFIGFATAGFGIVILVVALVVGMLILSLIPIYVPNNSDHGFGESNFRYSIRTNQKRFFFFLCLVYTIPGLTIKVIYTNLTVNFTGGSVLSLTGLSNIVNVLIL